MVLSYIILDNRLLMEDNQLNARTGPPAGPIQAKMAENACMGPHIGPVRALKSRASASGSSAGAGNDQGGYLESRIVWIYSPCAHLLNTKPFAHVGERRRVRLAARRRERFQRILLLARDSGPLTGEADRTTLTFSHWVMPFRLR